MVNPFALMNSLPKNETFEQIENKLWMDPAD